MNDWITIAFHPQPDITAYELAQILAKQRFQPGAEPGGIGDPWNITREAFAVVDPALKRHFVEVP